MEKSRRFSTISLATACVAFLLSLPLLRFAWIVVEAWIKIRLRPKDAFYIESWPSTWELIIAVAEPTLILLIVIGVLASLRSSWPRWPVIALPMAIAITLCSLVIVPNLPLWDGELFQNSIHLATLEHLLLDWSRVHNRYPTTQLELKSALKDELESRSTYKQNGQTLDYQTNFLPNQVGPYRVDPGRPGIVYYAVNESCSQFWLTVSGLNTAVSNRAAMLKTDPFTASKQPWGNLLVVSDDLVLIQKR